ncbi:lipoprotein [Dactylosporangium sucinum]|uniref:Lipoprotein n=2 Tax=Dactylosporangium sucinum TaxID=1424081 RepID=A0A917U2H4_9ACTN|nr:lipoprotein [Dactylosporangium sucinum]
MLATLATVAALALAGCGHSAAPDAGGAGDIPDNQAFVAYHPAGAQYSIKVPEGWSRSESGGTATFTDKLNTITVTLGAAASAPDIAAGQAELAALRNTTSGFTPGQVSMEQRTAGPVLLIRYRADADPDPVTGKVVNDDVERYEYWHSPADLLTVTLAGPHGADNVDPWRTVTDSVRWRS